MSKALLSGNEAIAHGARAGGATFGAGYPGTPSTEILETFCRLESVYAEWAPNEKVALEVAFGASLGGARSLVTMKHVGLNVAADPLFTIAYTGVEAGLLVVSADDPGMYSSQNEQDNRGYARMARVPMLEPSTPQEAHDMARAAFELSEQWDLPILLRTVTRLAHSKRMVEVLPPGKPPQPAREYTTRPEKYVMIPAHARRRRADLERRLALAREAAEVEHPVFNRIEWRDTALGVITSGVVYGHVREALPEASVLKLGLSWPLPIELIRRFAAGVDRIAVIEELDPWLEHDVAALGIELSPAVRPLQGPIDAADIRKSFVGASCAHGPSVPVELPSRPPLLCPGCPYRPVFFALHKRKAIVMGDIGCYTLGALPPLSAMDITVCMGASIGAAHGFLTANPDSDRPVCAVIGDSTFMHSGITGLADIAYNSGRAPVIVLDNRTTAMTGRQPNPASGSRITGEKAPAVDLTSLAASLGIPHTDIVEPVSIEVCLEAIDRVFGRGEPSLLVFRKPCMLLGSATRNEPLTVDPERCNLCGACLRLGCPAIAQSPSAGTMLIDRAACTGCALCAEVCRFDAIVPAEGADG